MLERRERDAVVPTDPPAVTGARGLLLDLAL